MATLGAGQTVVGIWKPGLEHGKVTGERAKAIAVAKKRIASSSLKINKDKTFGCLMIDKVMRGVWSWDGQTLTLRVQEIIGMPEKQFKALPESERVARMQFKGGKMVTLPYRPGQTNMVWKKVG